MIARTPVALTLALAALCAPGGAYAGEIVIEASGPGRVTSIPPGIDCRGDTGGACRAQFGAGEGVTLTAQAGAGGAAAWDDRCYSKTQPGERATCTDFATGASKTIGVAFTASAGEEVSVVLTRNGGTVLSEPAGISCPPACTATFPRGAPLTLRAVPVRGFFARFPGCSDASRTCAFVVDGPRTVTADFFARNPMPGEVRIGTRGPGFVMSPGAPLSYCPIECVLDVSRIPRELHAAGGAFADPTDTPGTLGVFDHWEGECSRLFEDQVCRVGPAGDRVLETTAVFRENAKLLAGVTGEGRIVTVTAPARDDPRLTCGDRSCAKRLKPRGRYVFRAVPSRGHEFARWTGWCSRLFEDETCTITETAFPNARVATTAEFRRATRGTVTVAVQGTGRVRYGDRSCTRVCADRIEVGDNARYAADAGEGWEFDRWEDCPAASGTTCRVGDDRRARTLRAVFSPRVRVSFRVRGSGRVTGSGLTGCTTSCFATLAAGGGDRTFTASPASGWVFDHWEGYCSRIFENATCRVRGIHRHESAVAVFRRR